MAVAERAQAVKASARAAVPVTATVVAMVVEVGLAGNWA